MAAISEGKPADQKLGTTLYEIRRNGVTHCHSFMENCGYSPKTIKEMQVAGFDLYINGEKPKRRGKR